MKLHPLQSVSILAFMLAVQASATVRYVDLNCANPAPPYTNWSSAATNIQVAVDAASGGDTIWVTNGIYATGGRAVGTNQLVNRVAVYKPLVLQSVNGPQFTFIQGFQVPGANYGLGDGAIRCVYLTNGAMLSGFTLTNGATRGYNEPYGSRHSETCGGGLWCESTNAVASNCVLVGSSAWYGGGGAAQGTLNDCTVTSNLAVGNGGGVFGFNTSAYVDPDEVILNNCSLTANSAGGNGGGAYGGTLNNCVVSGNSAPFGTGTGGGGTAGANLNNCVVSDNDAHIYGGGTMYGTLNNCVISGNTAGLDGGGSSYNILNNCMLIGNSATYFGGGGAYYCTLNNCGLIGNSSGIYGTGGGAGAFMSALTNCTVAGNSAQHDGGGVYGGTNNNCIIYGNTCGAGTNLNYAADFNGQISLNYCCTTPQPTNGFGNITNDPLFVDLAGGNLRLQSNSPCINSGKNSYAPAGPDLDGNPRIQGGTVDIGAYEFQFPTSVISYAWLQQYGFPTDGTADTADPDGDAMNNTQEWIAGTNPTNPLSVLQMLTPSNALSGVSVTWQSVAGITYYLQRSTNLAVQPRFLSLQSNIVGQASTTTFMDTNAVGSRPSFYRVGVQP